MNGFVAERGFPWSEHTGPYHREAVLQYFTDAKNIRVDGWYYWMPKSFGNPRFMQNSLDDQPIMRSTLLSDPNGRVEINKMMLDYFESLEYSKGRRFFIFETQGLFNSNRIGLWCRFEDLFEFINFEKRAHHFSILNIDEGIYYKFRSEEYFFALYEHHTEPPNMDLHEHFFKIYDFESGNILVHVKDKPNIGPIIVNDPQFIPREERG